MYNKLLILFYAIIGFQFCIILFASFLFSRSKKYNFYLLYLLCLLVKACFVDFVLNTTYYEKNAILYTYIENNITVFCILSYCFFFFNILPFDRFMPWLYRIISHHFSIVVICLLAYLIIYLAWDNFVVSFLMNFLMALSFILGWIGIIKMRHELKLNHILIIIGSNILAISALAAVYVYIKGEANNKYDWFPVFVIGTVIESFFFAFGLLYDSFKDGIQKAKLELKVSELERKDLINKNLLLENEFTILRAKITPHFLQNTFDLMGNKIYDGNTRECIYIIKTVSAYLRQVFYNIGKTVITLEDELDFTENYLLMQQSIHGNSFNYQINLENDVDTYNILVPSMILQPIVENCIKHGFKKKESGGIISINVLEEDNYCTIMIQDNGEGLPQNSDKPAPTSKGIELTRKRLGLMFQKDNLQDLLINLKNREDGISGTEFIIKFFYPLK